MMDILDLDGSLVGHVARFEIDRSGRLDGIIATDVAGIGSRTRIPVALVERIERNRVIVSVSGASLDAASDGSIPRHHVLSLSALSADHAA